MLLYSSHLPLGVPNGLVIHHASSNNFLAPLQGKSGRPLQGEFFAHTSFISKTQKNRIHGSCFYLSTFSFAEMATPENTKLCDFTSTNNSDFICTPIAPPAPATNFYEIKPALLNLVMKE
jgi:hypothetical protein